MAERSPYVAIPRDLDADPAFVALSRDAQWLLQHLARDPYRLKCGVFVYNERLIARAAKAPQNEVGTWWEELIGAGWIIEDIETGEAWLTAHMKWDNTLSNPNHAKAVQRDVKRIRSPKLSATIEKILFAQWPNLDPGSGINPGWIEATDDGPEPATNLIGDAIADGIRDGIEDGTPNPRTPYPYPDTRSTTPDTRNPEHGSPDTAPPPAPDPRTGAQCEKCEGTGIHHGERDETVICTCRAGRELGGGTTLRVVS